MNRIINLMMLISTILFLYGCAGVLLVGAGAGLGVGTYKYIDGNLAMEYPLEYNRAWNSTNRALENLQISLSSSTNENGKGMIEAVRKDGKKVIVKLKDNGNGVTTIAVRVGTLGDRLEDQKIHDEIVAVAGI
jgi:uncharacterized lipoprotein